jgi:glycerophosphoryl diester phosphodiesterase
VARWPKNFAHRGASVVAPENTLEAFRLAAESGAGGLELDVHMTRDGRIVVIHDGTVDRTTDGAGAVRRMSLAEVQGFDAGYRFTPDGGASYPWRGRGVRVPELGEVLRAFPEHAVNVDVKEERPGIEAAVLREVRAAGAEGRVLVVSETGAVVGRLRRLAGGRVQTGASRREIRTFYLLSRLGLEALISPAYDALQVPVEHRGTRVVTQRFVRAAHRRGVRVDVWTVNDAARMREVLDLGADAVMTDDPGLLAEVLAREAPG